MGETTETRDLDLSEVWDALTAAGATVYEVCEDGVACGEQAVRIGTDTVLTVSDSEGYTLGRESDYGGNISLTPSDEYDDDEAVRDASDLDGFFGVVGVPGSQYHAFEWFADRDEASAWVDRTHDATRADNPVIGTLEAAVLTAKEAFEVEYRDGSRVYFRPRQVGPGYEPKWDRESENPR